ncbi:hypothetical protein [Weissella viridescens]|uniref:hypothetical protein n=1 Tax=Weissella viridescens TaxID=1629 RepID=UPI0035292E42
MDELENKVKQYRTMVEEGLITQDEYELLSNNFVDQENELESTDKLEQKDSYEVSKIKEYKHLLDTNVINIQEYEKLKNDILSPKNNSVSVNQMNVNSDLLFTVLGFGFAALSLIFFPVIFGTMGVVAGYLLTRKENLKSRGVVIIIVNIGAAIFGMLLGMAVVGI